MKKTELPDEQKSKIIKKRTKQAVRIVLLVFMLTAFGIYAIRETGGCSIANKSSMESAGQGIPAAAAKESFDKAEGKKKIVAYYLHGNSRCHVCNRIEKDSREAVEQGFKESIDSGVLAFKAVNIDRRANSHYINNFKINTKALVIVLYNEDRQENYKVLSDIWIYLNDKEKFLKYIRDEIATFLREVS